MTERKFNFSNISLTKPSIFSALGFKVPLVSKSVFLNLDRWMTERKFNHEVWFLYYPEEGNKRGAPTQLTRGVEFGLETKALLYKRLCAYAGLHAEVILYQSCHHEWQLIALSFCFYYL